MPENLRTVKGAIDEVGSMGGEFLSYKMILM